MQNKRTFIVQAMLAFTLSTTLVTSSAWSQTGAGSTLKSGGLLRKLPAGTLAEPKEHDTWNRVIALARPKIASGDIDALPASIRSAVSSFVLTIMAKVEKQADGKYRLADVGAGYSVPIDGTLTVVTPDKAIEVGASLGFVQRQMLSQNDSQLKAIPVIAQNSQLLIFDTPAILLRDSTHVDLTMRHFVWLDWDSGKTATLVWLLQPDSNASRAGSPLRVVDEPLRWLPPGLKESREIHVDGQEFSLLGIPTQRAFALEDLPPGRELEWSPAGKRVAGLTTYSSDQLRDLAAALNESLAARK